MNNVKKIYSFLMPFVTAILCLTLPGCSNNTTDKGQESTIEQVSLETVTRADMIDFENSDVEISIHSDVNFYFSNKNKEFCARFIEFLKNPKFSLQKTGRTDSQYYSIGIRAGEEFCSFFVYETDIIAVQDAAESSFYYCKGVYDEFEKCIGGFLEENSRYYCTAETPVRKMYEYVIYDKSYTVMESEYIAKPPYIFYDSGIVHLWVQTGTGILSRYARFYDVEERIISPTYYGQTDYFGDLVCVAGSSQVNVYKMFSGEQVFCFDSFEKPLADCTENICSAYFTEDGTGIVVEYLNTDFVKEQQVIDLPTD